MSDEEAADADDGASQPVSVYTGPRSLADAKVAFGEWLESRRS